LTKQGKSGILNKLTPRDLNKDKEEIKGIKKLRKNFEKYLTKEIGSDIIYKFDSSEGLNKVKSKFKKIKKLQKL